MTIRATYTFDHESFAEALKSFRELQGKSLTEAAKEFGIHPSHLSKLERGVLHGPARVILLAFYADLDLTKFIVKTNEHGLPLWKGK